MTNYFNTIKTGAEPMIGDLMKEADLLFKNAGFDSDFISNQVMNYMVEESEGGYLLEIPVPGLSKEDVKIEIDSNKIKINLEKDKSKWILKKDYAFIAKRGIDLEGIEAKVENGVLKIQMPNLSSASKTIEVK